NADHSRDSHESYPLRPEPGQRAVDRDDHRDHDRRGPASDLASRTLPRVRPAAGPLLAPAGADAPPLHGPHATRESRPAPPRMALNSTSNSPEPPAKSPA